MKKTYRGLSALLAAYLLLSASGCSAPERHSVTWYTYFDTVTTVTGYGSEAEFIAACHIIEDTVSRYHEACDIYHEYSGKVNARTVNLHAGTGPLTPMPELLDVLSFGREAWELTDGMCNIAMGAVLSLWHDCREAALNGEMPRLPDEKALEIAAKHCDIQNIVLDINGGTVELLDPAMSLDLGAVAKGFATEQAADKLEAAGYSGYVINLGGNVRAVGFKPDGETWTVGIQDPNADVDGDLLRLSLADGALVTSGSYQRYYMVDGVRYHHIISPETLYPRDDLLSVTVRSGDSALADALSTGLFNMSPDVGLNYVNQMVDVEACWILPSGEIIYSDGFEAGIVS